MTLFDAIKEIYLNPLSTYLIYLFVISFSASVKTNNSIDDAFKKRKNNFLSKTPRIDKLYDNINLIKFNDSEYQLLIKDFCDFMLANYPSEYLLNFYNNINNIKILDNKLLFLSSVEGRYLPKDNTIEISKPSSIFHELFHMASCYIDKDNDEILYGGFRQILFNEHIDIGSSLNEGYTELLAHRYFSQKYKMPLSYQNEINVVKKIEDIIGKKEMETMYLNANLKGLVDNLEKYISHNKILDFIAKLDIISNNSSNMFLTKNDTIFECFTGVCEFLLKLHTNKLKQDLDNHLITEEEFIKESLNYLKSFKKVVTIGRYNYLPLEDVPMLYNWQAALEKNIHVKNKKY